MSKAKYIPEGGSSNRPPYFDGTDYYHWKGKIRLFLISQDNNIWEEYDRVEECKSAKELWDTLRIHHEGTSHVKEARIDMGKRKNDCAKNKPSRKFILQEDGRGREKGKLGVSSI
ncbi:uncharacterized protein [Cicer arietinum]|uniref:uncharacterized protein n=1 Tax=Cicer arietinum TaxID=3827 RepID=UPI003CC59D0E